MQSCYRIRARSRPAQRVAPCLKPTGAANVLPAKLEATCYRIRARSRRAQRVTPWLKPTRAANVLPAKAGSHCSLVTGFGPRRDSARCGCTLAELNTSGSFSPSPRAQYVSPPKVFVRIWIPLGIAMIMLAAVNRLARAAASRSRTCDGPTPGEFRAGKRQASRCRITLTERRGALSWSSLVSLGEATHRVGGRAPHVERWLRDCAHIADS